MAEFTLDKFIIPNGSPSAGNQEMQSTVVGPDNVAANVTVIRSEADFPTPVGGISTWTSGVYIIDGVVSHASTIRRGTGAQIWITGFSLTSNALVYTGTGAQFDHDPTDPEDLNSLLNITRLGLFQSGAASKMFDFDASAGRQGTFWLEKVYMLGDLANTSTLGDVKNFAFCTLIESVIAVQFDAGLSIDNIGQLSVNCQFSEWKDSGGTFLSLGSGTFDRINISGAASFFVPKATESALYINPAATFNTIATITGVSFTPGLGDFFKTGSKDQTTPTLNVVNCGIADSSTSAEIDAGEPTVSTVIPASGANVLLNSDTWASYEKERISVDTNGVSSYDGLRASRLQVHFSASIEPASGTNKLLELQIGRVCPDPITVTFDNTTNTVVEVGTAVANGDLVSFYDTAGTLPAALRTDVFYYVVNKATDSFQLSYTSGGSAITFADNGTPTNSYKPAALEPIKSSGNIDSGSPSSLTRFGIASVLPGEKVGIVARNTSDATNIDTNSGGYIVLGF